MMANELTNLTTTTTSSSSGGWWYLDNDGQQPDGNQSILSESMAATIATVAATADPAFVRFRDESRFWVQRVLLPIVGTIGVFGNGATILVLTRRGMRSSTNAYLTALAIADLIYLLCVFWLSLRHYPHIKDNLNLANFYAYTWPYSLWLTDATTNTSVWLTVTFTVERYIAVCHPIRGRMLCTESRARRVIVAVYLICFTATLSTPFEWSVQEGTDPLTNATKAEIIPSHLGNDETYQTVYYWFTSISFVLLPLTLLIIFNWFLIQSVRQSQKLRQIMTQRQTISGTSEREERAASNEIRITVTLIAVVIMFLVCQLPTAATLIYKIFHEPKPQSNEEAVLRALGNIFNCLVSLNAACNFLLYCALSDKYRRTFMSTFCRCLYRPASPVHSMAFFSQVDNDYVDRGGPSTGTGTGTGSGANHLHHHHQQQQQHHHHMVVANHINNSRQSSVRIAQHDRYVAGRQAQHHQHMFHRASSSTSSTFGSNNTSHATGSYLAIPDGNGTISRHRSNNSQQQQQQRSRSASLQSNSSGGRTPAKRPSNIVAAVLANPRPADLPSPLAHHRWTRWWPWQSSSSKRNGGSSKASNILIQISDVEEINHDSLQQPGEQSSVAAAAAAAAAAATGRSLATSEQVDDDEEQVAFV